MMIIALKYTVEKMSVAFTREFNNEENEIYLFFLKLILDNISSLLTSG